VARALLVRTTMARALLLRISLVGALEVWSSEVRISVA
jgi:hypothetical protein